MKKHLQQLISYNKIAFWLLILTWVALPGVAQSLQQQLFDLPDISFVQLPTEEGFEASYELRVKQPIDHSNPEKGYFYQRVFLSHQGYDRPTVIATEGYARTKNRVYEPTTILKANQLDVEHRYFGASIPDEVDYTYLNLEQATADLHHVRELLGQVYPEKWVSTGISKGGQTTIFYRYFYPEDVSVSIPYVAPLNLEFEEKRIYEWLNNIGTEECRKDLYDFQVWMLKNREPVLEKLRWYAEGRGLTFDYLTLEEAFEYAVLEYPFSFWQWGTNCSDIPSKSIGLDAGVRHLLAVSNIDFFADESMTSFASHYYQAAAEMGYYGYDTAPFKGLLKALPMSPNPHAAFTPNKMKVEFDNSVPKKAAEWLKKNGNQFIYINGATDTWSSTAVPQTDGVDALWYFLPNRDHGAARIRNMSAIERAKMIEKLEQWLDMDIE